jgi:hypothetical protein
LLETAWVLRSRYGFDVDAIGSAFAKLLGLENVQCEDVRNMAAALTLTQRGIDFADALHPCSRPPGAIFVSFDSAFIHRAKRAGVIGASSLAGRA